MEEMKPVMKNEKKYKLGIGKKIVAALIALGLVLGIGVGLVACNKDPVDQDQNPGIEQPGDPDDGKEDPDDGKEDPENPGGDIEEPTDPDDGKEDPENPGEPTDPDNPGEPTDPTDPENPGEELEPPQSVEDLFTNPDYQDSEYIIKVEDALDTYLKEKIISVANSNLDIKNIDDIEWRIDGSNSDTSINKITISFTNYASDTSRTIYVQSVTPKGELTLEDLYNPDETKLNNAFSTAIIGGAKYQNIIVIGFDPSIQESSAALTEALKNVAINDKDLEIEVDENTEYYIVDGGYQLDTTLGSTAREISLFIKNENGYQKLIYRIAEPNFDVDALVQKIEAGNYRMAATEKGEFTGNQISVSDKETVASTASEAYRLYGKMKAKDGSSVNTYLPEDLMNELE